MNKKNKITLLFFVLTLLACSKDEVINEQCGTVVLVHKNVSKEGYTIQIKTEKGYYFTYDDIMFNPSIGNKYCR